MRTAMASGQPADAGQQAGPSAFAERRATGTMKSTEVTLRRMDAR